MAAYHVVFFIFIVSNTGGLLTPIGDPPLYLGYLKGIPFFWTTRTLLPIWLIGMGWLLTLFWTIDHYNFSRTAMEVHQKKMRRDGWRFEGSRNLVWLGLILGALFLPAPWRELHMIFAAFFSWRFTPRHIHKINDFRWAPLREVAILFAGIFATMMPALDWLEINADRFTGISTGGYYWWTGLLSSLLDNAPTYLNFLSVGIGALGDRNISHFVANYSLHLAAISTGAVFFGACTYIGNGPNFMVKTIAEHAGAKMPGFFGFIFKFTLPILLPMLILVWWIFFQ